MKIFFVGGFEGNAGPINVNKSLRNNFTSSLIYVKSSNKYFKYIETFFKTIFSKVIVVSGVGRDGVLAIKIAKILHKKVVYIMHGCAIYEAQIEHEIEKLQQGIKYENFILEKSDLILAVSKKFSLWLKAYLPQYSNKIEYLYNGVEKPAYDIEQNKVKGKIIAVGGDRKIKNNNPVCNAVENLCGQATLKVFGFIHGDKKPTGWRYSNFEGLVPQEQLYHEMASSELFVLNSILEPFSLSVIDALNCKCSILVSQYVGVTDLLKLEDSDLIYNPNDEEEIRTKIQYLLNHPNYERIIKSVDYNKLSYKVRVNELENKCKELIQ